MKVEKITPQIAALYIGQEATLSYDNEPNKTGVLTTIRPVFYDRWPLGFEIPDLGLVYYGCENVMFHLRRLKSLTESEAREMYRIASGMVWEKRSDRSCLKEWWQRGIEDSVLNEWLCIGIPAVWLKLIEWGFDLFGLIDAGLAKEIEK